jgi:hypothetical protein
MYNSILSIKLSNEIYFSFLVNHNESIETIKDVFFMATLTQSPNQIMNLVGNYLECKNIDFSTKLFENLEDLKKLEIYKKTDLFCGFDKLRLCYYIE